MNRTKTYIAADWDGDKDAINELYKWNESDHWGLSFVNVHDFKQAKDTSFPCTIKNSLHERMNMSKVFILIVGQNTDTVTKGSCRYCSRYRSYLQCCATDLGKATDNRSFIKYECEQALKAGIRIVVLYNSLRVDKSKCPEVLRDVGSHLAMRKLIRGTYDDYKIWDYQKIKNAIEE